MEPDRIDVLEQMTRGFMLLDQDLRVTYANPALLAMLHTSRGELYERSIDSLLAAGREPLDPSDFTGEKPCPVKVISGTGAELNLELSFSPVFDKDDSLVGYGVLVNDVSILTRRNDLLERKLKFYMDIASSASDWFWETDSSGTYTFASDSVTEHIGYSPGELFGRTPFDLMEHEEAQRVAAAFNRVAATGRRFRDLINRVILPGGEERVMSTCGVPVWDGFGNLSGYRGADRDVTRETRSRERFRGALETIWKTLDLIPAGVVVADGSGRVLRASRSACAMAGIEQGSAPQSPVKEVFCRGCVEKTRLSCSIDQSATCLYDLVSAEGNAMPVMKTVTRVPFRDVMLFVHIITDLTDVYRRHEDASAMEEELKGLRLRVAGAKGIHGRFFRDVMDGLCGIAACADLLKSGAAGPVEVASMLQTSGDAVSSALNSLRSKHDYAAEEFSSEEETFLLSSVLRDAVAPAAKAGVRIRTECEDSPGSAWYGPARGIRSLISILLENVPAGTEVFVGICSTGGDDSTSLRLTVAVTGAVQSMEGEAGRSSPLFMKGAPLIAECSRFAGSLGGELIHEVSPGGGARLWTDLPVKRVRTDPVSAEVPAGTRVVVVSCNRELAAIWTRLAVAAGYHAFSSPDWDAPVLFEPGNTVIIADMDCETLRPIPAGTVSRGRIIAVVSRVRAGDISLWERAGCAALLMKPLSMARLRSVLACLDSRKHFLTDSCL